MKRRVRHRPVVVVVVAPIAAGMALAAACASPYAPSDPQIASSEAGAESAAGDAGDARADASAATLSPTPGKIECFGDTCSTASSQSCCFDADAGTTRCAAVCTVGDFFWQCDDRSDCAPGKRCCVSVFGTADCESTCNGERLCHTDDECDVGSSCVVLACRGTTIGACGPVGPYVKALCDPRDQ